MSVHDHTTSRDAGSRARVRHARSAARQAGLQRDGVLTLVPAIPAEPSEPADRSDPLTRLATAHEGMLEQLRAERDAALEEVAFLREQLRSARAYHVHELEEQCAHLHAERKVLLRQLAILGERLRRQGRRMFASDGERTTDEVVHPPSPR